MKLGTGRDRLVVADQAISSLTNFCASGYALLALKPDELGRFTAPYALAGVLVSTARALTAEPVVVAVAQGRARFGEVARSAGLVALLVCLVAAPISFASNLRVFLLLVAGLSLAECVRVAHLSIGSAGLALSFDALWLLALVACLVVVTPKDGIVVFALWALIGSALGALWFVADEVRLRSGFKQWLVSLRLLRRRVSLRLGGEQLTEHGVLVLVIGALAYSGGAVEVGRFGALRTIFGPIALGLVLFPALRIAQYATSPELKVMQKNANTLSLLCAIYAICVALAYGALTSLGAPEERWFLIVPFGIYLALSAQLQVVRTALKALEEGGRLLLLRMVLTGLLALTIGALLAVDRVQAGSVILSLVVTSAVAVPFWWRALSNQLRTV